MLSVRLPETLEQALNDYCSRHRLTKSQVVQQALRQWLEGARVAAADADTARPSGRLQVGEPLAHYIGIARGGMSTDALMRMTRGDDWNKP